jgi:predicted aspartyl protease
MTQITIINGLPFITAIVEINSQIIHLEYVLIDTGSEACIFKTDDFEKLGVKQQLTDTVTRMIGVGGYEYVVERQVDKLSVGELAVEKFAIQTGALEYGIRIDGILGTDCLQKTGAKIDFAGLLISK